MSTHRAGAISASFRYFVLPQDILPEDFMIDVPPVERPDGGMKATFNANAAIAAEDYKKLETQDLWRKVCQDPTHLTPREARAFTDGCMTSRFANDPAISDPRAKKGLAAFDFETLIAIYEKVAEDDMPLTSIYLRELNKALDPGAEFYDRRADPVRMFFSRANTATLEQKWTAAKAAGRIGRKEGTFSDALSALLSHPPLLEREEFKRRADILQFIADSYSDYIGEPPVKLKLFQGMQGIKGFQTDKDSEHGEMIAINIQELHDFRACINILMHERQHTSQSRLADRLVAGKIRKDDPDYVAARLFQANRARNGYISPMAPAGSAGYVYQPMEVDANNAGNTAEYHAARTYGRPPKPHTAPQPLAA